MFDLEWSRPAALATLLVPALVLLLSLRRERPTPQAIGTFSLWRDLPEGGAGGGRRRRIPLERWLIVAALICGGLALAGPRRADPPLTRRWRVVVDASPSLFLPHPDGGTRLDAALATLERIRRREGVTLGWSRPGTPGDERGTSSWPEDWSTAPWPPRSEPGWGRHDEPGTLWLTDRAPAQLPALAGVVASGGPAVPGRIGRVGERWLDWDGEELVEAGAAPQRRIEVGAGLPSAIVAVVRSWAEERGLDGEEGEVALSVELAGEGAPAPTSAGRDGWSAAGRGRAAPLLEDGQGLETWLAAGDGGLPLVTRSPGRVRVGWVELEGLSGDPAAFAVSWSELLDGALLPPRGATSLAERRSAGESLVRLPRPRVGGDDPEPLSWPLTAVLSALAAGLVFLALVLGRGRL